MKFRKLALTPHLENELKQEPGATEVVQSEDRRYWFSNGVLVWGYWNETAVVAGYYEQLVEQAE